VQLLLFTRDIKSLGKFEETLSSLLPIISTALLRTIIMKAYIYAGCLLALVFDLEDVGSTFLRNVGEIPQDCTT
jgi:hypothetical protein